MQVVFYFDSSDSVKVERALQIEKAIQDKIVKALDKLPLTSEIGGRFPFFHQALYHFLHRAYIANDVIVGVFITNTYADNGTSRTMMEAHLQRYLNNQTFILIATLSSIDEALKPWLRHLTKTHPSHNQIEVLWHDNKAEKLQEKLIPWIQRKLNPPAGSSSASG